MAEDRYERLVQRRYRRQVRGMYAVREREREEVWLLTPSPPEANDIDGREWFIISCIVKIYSHMTKNLCILYSSKTMKFGLKATD